MEFEKTQDRSGKNLLDKLTSPSRLPVKRGLSVGLVLLVALFCAAQTSPPPNPNKPLILPIANREPDANDRMEMNDKQTKQKNFEAANIERKKQIADDSAALLKLAAELKLEVDKTNKDTLSLTVIRKADAIERLAHNVKEKMKLSVGAN